MGLEQEIREMLQQHSPPDPKLFEDLVAGSETAVAASDLLGIILKQNALEQALLRLTKHVEELAAGR